MNPEHDPALMEFPAPRRLSSDLEELLAKADGQAMSIGELEAILQGRGAALLVMIFVLPFVFPIPIPGLSIPFGVVVMLMGMRIAMGRKPSLPRMILKYQVKYSVLKNIVSAGLKFCKLMEKVVKPRMHFLQKWPGMLNLIGVGIASGGFLLFLPIPPVIPASNCVPAISVLLLTAGMIERDGLMVLAGYLTNIIAYVYFAFMAVVLRDFTRHILQYFGF